MRHLSITDDEIRDFSMWSRTWVACFVVQHVAIDAFHFVNHEAARQEKVPIYLWCRKRFGRPIASYSCGDIIRPWTANNWEHPCSTIYFSETDHAIEFKMRWL